MLRQQINDSIKYLQSLGPNKIWRMIAELGMERLNKLSREINNQEKILEIYQNCPFEKVLTLMKQQSDTEIVMYMNALKSSEIQFLLNNLSWENIQAWNSKVPYKQSILMLEKIGARHSFYILTHIGLEKAAAIWKIARTETLIEIVQKIGVKESVQIGQSISLKDMRLWKKNHDLTDICFFQQYLGTPSLILFYTELSMDKILRLLEIFSKEEIIALFQKIKTSPSPKISAKQLRALQESPPMSGPNNKAPKTKKTRKSSSKKKPLPKRGQSSLRA